MITVVVSFFVGFSGEVLFFGFYVMMVYNILVYWKRSKRPLVELVLVQPFGLLTVALLLPSSVSYLIMMPVVLFVFGSMFALMSFLYILQERDKSRRCNTPATALVVDNIKIFTTKTNSRKKHYGASKAYSYKPIIRYAASGKTYEITYGDGFPSPMTADAEVAILYNSHDPEEFCFADKKQTRPLRITAIVFFTLGMAFVLFSIYYIISLLFFG